MPFTIEKLPDEPILAIRLTNPLDVRRDIPRFAEELRAQLDSSPEPLYNVTGAEELTLTFSDIVAALAILASGEMSVSRHPKTAGDFVAVSGDLVRLAVNAMGQRQYGNVPVKVFQTFNEALNAARETVQERAAENKH